MGFLRVLVWLIYILLKLLFNQSNKTEHSVMWYGMEMNWEAIAGFLGVAVALAAVLFAYRTYKQSEITARNSLRPYLTYFRLHDLYDSKNIFIDVRNSGVGPAIIKKITWKSLDKQIDDDIINYLEKKFTGFSEHYRNRVFDFSQSFDSDDVIGVGETFVLLSFEDRLFNYQNDASNLEITELWEKMLAEIDDLNFVLAYESIYGDKYDLIVPRTNPKHSR